MSDETKVDQSGVNGQNQTQHKHLIPAVMQGGGEVMIWGCLAVTGPEQLADTESTRNSAVYQREL